MQYGGTLSFYTRNLELSETQCKASVSGLTPGSYIEIQVKDTGCGIPQEYLSRIFEPFFTTKERGRGTGLGLSEAHGTVVSHRGAISVYSEPEKGTAFHILLPLSKDVASDLTSELKAIHGKGCILLVDDEQVMRTCGEVILSDYGYSILLAENGKHALEVLKEKEQKIDLVILDMIMPEMNGRDCFFHIKEDYPHIPVILASGFTRNDDLQELRQCGLAGFIQKPFRGVELSHIVYEAIQKK
jgi:CheY-like chemotaxis protein